MKSYKYCLAATLLVSPSIAQSQSGTVEVSKTPPAQMQPSPAALQLAKALAIPRLTLLLGRTTPAEMKDQIKRQLLSTTLATRGRGCDSVVPECQAAAEAIAAKHATEFAQAINDSIDRGQAMIFDATMSPSQIRTTLDFFRTDAGRAFAASVRKNPSSDRFLLTRILGTVKLPAAPFDEFYDATKDLPRSKIMMAPPPPAPPPAMRRDR